MLRTILVFTLWSHALAKVAPRKEIAPGVYMPLINYGDERNSLWLSLGGRGIDTAYEYHNQAAVRRALATSPVGREEIFVTSKIPCCPSSPIMGGWWCANPRINIHDVGKEIELAVSNLDVRYVDLLLMHYPCATVEDTVAVYRAMEAYLARGLTRAIGISNFNTSLIDALLRETSVKPAVIQNSCSIGNHFSYKWGNDDATLKYLQEKGITLSSWASLGRDSGTSASIFRSPTVSAIAAAHNKSNAQVALRWLVQRGVVPVTSGSNPEHMAQDLDFFDFELAGDEMQRLSAIGSNIETVLYS